MAASCQPHDHYITLESLQGLFKLMKPAGLVTHFPPSQFKAGGDSENLGTGWDTALEHIWTSLLSQTELPTTRSLVHKPPV